MAAGTVIQYASNIDDIRIADRVGTPLTLTCPAPGWFDRVVV